MAAIEITGDKISVIPVEGLNGNRGKKIGRLTNPFLTRFVFSSLCPFLRHVRELPNPTCTGRIPKGTPEGDYNC